MAPAADWQDVKVELPANGRVIHVRLAFLGRIIPDIAAIELRGTNTTASARWAAEPKPSPRRSSK